MDSDAVLPFLSTSVRVQLRACSGELVFLILCMLFSWVTPPPKIQISLSTLSSKEVYHLTHFKPKNIKYMTWLLHLPDRITISSGWSFHCEETLFLLLVSLVWPLRLQTIQLFFRFGCSIVYEITNWMLCDMYLQWNHLLCDFDSSSSTCLLKSERLRLFADC